MNAFVRPAKAGDTTVLADIGAETFALACPPSTPQADLEAYIESELTAQRFVEHLASSSTSLFVAEIQGHIAVTNGMDSSSPYNEESRRVEVRK